MLLTYDHLNADELQGSTQADYLVSLEANFCIYDRDRLVYAEPSFPVVELARSMLIWLEDPSRGDFEFDSMSFEEVGSVVVRHKPSGWTFGSVFCPSSESSPVSWIEAQRSTNAFVSKVGTDLIAMGLDPDEVIRR